MLQLSHFLVNVFPYLYPCPCLRQPDLVVLHPGPERLRRGLAEDEAVGVKVGGGRAGEVGRRGGLQRENVFYFLKKCESLCRVII